MNKIYHLSTCDTCKRIIKELGLKQKKFIFQDIKSENINQKQLEEIKEITGSYESIFSKKARKYQALKNKTLSENDMKKCILEEYTFLKRPVIVINNKVFSGTKKEDIAKVKQLLKG